MIGFNPSFQILFLLMAGHALADFSLQTEFMAIGKNRNTELGKDHWFYCLTGHAFIQGGIVLLLTGSLGLGITETILHWIIDFLKCENRISFRTDQFLHIFCKITWWACFVIRTSITVNQ
jgi:hypothetical protein